MRIGKGESPASGLKESALNTWHAILLWPPSRCSLKFDPRSGPSSLCFAFTCFPRPGSFLVLLKSRPFLLLLWAFCPPLVFFGPVSVFSLSSLIQPSSALKTCEGYLFLFLSLRGEMDVSLNSLREHLQPQPRLSANYYG